MFHLFPPLITSLIAILIGIASIIYVYSTWNFAYWKNRGVPYEKPVAIFGNLAFVLRKSIINFFYEVYQKHPKAKYVGLYLCRRPVLLVGDVDLAKKILQTDFDTFQDRSLYSGYADPLGSLNLFTVNSPTWHDIRRLVSPMFTTSRLKSVHTTMDTTALQLVERIEKDHVLNNKDVDLKLLFSLFTTDVIGSTVFGLKGEALEKTASPLWTITSHMVKFNWYRGLEFMSIFFTPSIAEMLRLQYFSSVSTEYVRKMFWSVARDRIDTQTVGQTKDFLDMLLKIKATSGEDGFQITEDTMIAQAAVFLLGGFETSSSILTYAIYELAFHQDEQETLYREIQAVDKLDVIMDYEALLEMKYLTKVLNETLRKYPSLPYLDRICNKDYQLDEHLLVEKGTPVFVNAVGIQYDEKYFPEPHRWNPARFDENPPPFSWLPFGEGPRFCIGKRYGMLQLKTAIVHILRRYRVQPTPGLPAPGIEHTDPNSIFVAPSFKVNVQFVPRAKLERSH